MTPRQKDALRWLERVGEASEFAVHRAGYQHRTMEALRISGRIHGELVEGRCRPYWVYTHPVYAVAKAVGCAAPPREEAMA